ncbi:MAG: thiol reductant ABC exporter subunit CydD [Chlorobi bacterium]|nr:thiol reductant ABC exporter subunit CydD [Chlorobiota bacterium]
MFINSGLLEYAKKRRTTFLLSVFFGLLSGFAAIAIAFFLSKGINDVFLLRKDLSDVSNITTLFIAASFLKAVFIILKEYFSNKLSAEIKIELRSKLIRKLFSLGPVHISGEKRGELANTISNGVEKIDVYFSRYLPQLFLSALIPLSVLVFIFPIDFLTGVIFLLTAPLIPFFMYLIGTAAEKQSKKQWKSLSRMSAYFFDVLKGITALKIFGRSKDEIKKIFDVTNDFKNRTMKVLRIAFLSALALELLSTLSIAIVAVEIGLRLLNSGLEFQDALFILILAPEFYLPIRQLGTGFHAGLDGVSAFARIDRLFSRQIDGKNISEINNQIVNSCELINFKNISFIYKERKENALNNISFEIKRNEKVALVGHSGAGKSTIFNLFLRFIEPSGGIIFYNGKDIRLIDVNDWRTKISWAPQSPHIFNGTIKKNIALSKPEASDKEIIEAAKNADIHETILSFPDGYDTLVGEDGGKLSGGQIHRISLARAFLRDSEILLIDEPTANLAPASERKILSSIEKLTKNKTSLIIAHRLNTIMNADKILVFSKGKIVESGKHESLINTGKYYRALYETYQRSAV